MSDRAEGLTIRWVGRRPGERLSRWVGLLVEVDRAGKRVFWWAVVQAGLCSEELWSRGMGGGAEGWAVEQEGERWSRRVGGEAGGWAIGQAGGFPRGG